MLGARRQRRQATLDGAAQRAEQPDLGSISIVMVVLTAGEHDAVEPSRSPGDRTTPGPVRHMLRERECARRMRPASGEDPDQGCHLLRRPALRSGPTSPRAESSSSLGMAGISMPCIAFPRPVETSARVSRLVEARSSVGDDRLGTLQGVLGLEDAGADENAIHAKLHHQRGVVRG